MAATEELEKRIAELDKLVREIVSSLVADATKRAHHNAETFAISQMLISLATRIGIPREDFVDELQERIKQALDSEMRRIEDLDPSLAALLDDREISDVSDADSDAPQTPS